MRRPELTAWDVTVLLLIGVAFAAILLQGMNDYAKQAPPPPEYREIPEDSS